MLNIYTKQLFIVNLKFKFNKKILYLSDNPWQKRLLWTRAFCQALTPQRWNY